MTRGESWGLAGAAASTFLGGTAVVATRGLSGAVDPFTMGVLRFGVGALCLGLVALLRREPWPGRSDAGAVGLFGVVMFAIVPWLFNEALVHTTAARGGLVISTMPLVTLAVAGAIGAERVTGRKLLGAVVALAGVAAALAGDLDRAPPGAWRGDLLMLVSVVVMTGANVLARPLTRRTSPFAMTAVAMVIGTVLLYAIGWTAGAVAGAPALGPGGLAAAAYLGIVCGAVVYLLWVVAIARVAPSAVSIMVTLNPIAASSLGLVFLGERFGPGIWLGIAAVAAGIWLSTSARALPAKDAGGG